MQNGMVPQNSPLPPYRGRELSLADIDAGIRGQELNPRMAQEQKALLLDQYTRAIQFWGPQSPRAQQEVIDAVTRAIANGDRRAADEILNAYQIYAHGRGAAMTRRAAGGFPELQGQYHPTSRFNPAAYERGVPGNTPLSDPSYAPGYNNPRHPKYY